MSAVRPLDLFEELLGAPSFAAPLRPRAASGPAPLRYMSRRDDDAVTVRVELPGVRAEDLELSCVADSDGTVIDLSASRDVFGASERLAWSARLRGVDPATVAAELTDGVLVLRGELAQPSARRIEVTAGQRTEAIDAASADADADDAG